MNNLDSLLGYRLKNDCFVAYWNIIGEQLNWLSKIFAEVDARIRGLAKFTLEVFPVVGGDLRFFMYHLFIFEPLL